ncbi:MAG TPA: dihydroorotate dehydrogenase electron transfer subunit [Planctomycetes bacterium]|nr:dihydroorotate dehydrogenase electron transfer subunit [Planctomycetota bacterium]
MPAPPSDARLLHARLVHVRPTGDDGVVLRVRPERELPPLRASRFFMLKRLDGTSPMIPRPFSIYRQVDGCLEFLIKVMGRGTRALAEAPEGAELSVVGPLGNGWPDLDGESASWVLLGGGVGAAPFPMLIEASLARGVAPGRIHYLLGAATKGLLYDLDWPRDLAERGVRFLTATDDGSEGFHGNVLGLLERLWDEGELPREVRLLACGPDPMLHAVERLARERDLEAWLSLETLMGCGVGICNGCPVPTRPDGPLGAWGNAKCCVEGPVFSTREVTLG